MATLPDDLFNEPHVRTAVQTALIERFQTLFIAMQTAEREEAGHLEKAREVRGRINALDKEVSALKAVLKSYGVEITSVTDNGDGDTTVNTNIGLMRSFNVKNFPMGLVFYGGGEAVKLEKQMRHLTDESVRELHEVTTKLRRNREQARKFRETVLSAVKTILEVAGATPTKQLYDMLVAQKVDIESPERLSQILSAADLFVADRSKGWSLKGEEPGASTPSSSESTAPPSADGS